MTMKKGATCSAYNVLACQDTNPKNLSYILLSVFSSYAASEPCRKSSEKNCTESNRRFFYPVLLLVLIAVPLVFIMYKTYSHASIEKLIRSSLVEFARTAVRAVFFTTKVIRLQEPSDHAGNQ